MKIYTLIKLERPFSYTDQTLIKQTDRFFIPQIGTHPIESIVPTLEGICSSSISIRPQQLKGCRGLGQRR